MKKREGCLALDFVDQIAGDFPGTTFKQKVTADTRSMIGKLAGDPSTETWKSLGVLQHVRQSPDYYVSRIDYTFNNAGTETTLRDRDRPCVAVETRAPKGDPSAAPHILRQREDELARIQQREKEKDAEARRRGEVETRCKPYTEARIKAAKEEAECRAAAPPGGRRSRGSRVKKQTRRAQRKRRNTVRR